MWRHRHFHGRGFRHGWGHRHGWGWGCGRFGGGFDNCGWGWGCNWPYNNGWWC